MALDKNTQDILEEVFKKKLSEQFHKGIAVGVKTACRAVLDILQDGSKPYASRVEAVKQFCKTPFRMSTDLKTDKTEESSEISGEEEKINEKSEKSGEIVE